MKEREGPESDVGGEPENVEGASGMRREERNSGEIDRADVCFVCPDNEVQAPNQTAKIGRPIRTITGAEHVSTTVGHLSRRPSLHNTNWAHMYLGA